MDIDGVTQQYELGLFLVLSASMPDPCTARQLFPNQSTGRCSAPSHLSNGIRYVPARWIFNELTSLEPLDSMPDSSIARHPISILSSGQCSAPVQPSNGICYIST